MVDGWLLLGGIGLCSMNSFRWLFGKGWMGGVLMVDGLSRVESILWLYGK
jgi:hypothetical protein